MNKYYRYTILFIMLIISSCSSSTEPIREDTLGVLLSSTKLKGKSPLKVKYQSELIGDITGLRARVPEYLFNKGYGRFINYSIPDTTHELHPIWELEVEYPKGTYKAYLIFHGFRDSAITLYSDTLTIVSE